MDTFEYYGAKHNESIIETEQLVGGIYVIRKCQHTVDMVNEWYDGCCNYNLIDDSPSSIPNDPSFNENRHDQSIFSVVLKNMEQKWRISMKLILTKIGMAPVLNTLFGQQD